ncbi:sulfotransferase [Ponticaulis profundi]|uniref:Sulfotransferase n=1 Tax=Ponticaulis profundi TaxID=2665222 RepID=A0ABW1S484_9PROT
MTRKTFLLGVGCQKGGTTWVHDHLSKHPQCALGIAKEYHTFDTIASEQQRHLLLRSMKRLRFGLEKAERFLKSSPTIAIDNKNKLLDGFDLAEQVERNLRKVLFSIDREDYVQYFSRLAMQDSIRLTGDITPEYAVLSEQNFRDIKQLIEEKGDLKIKVLFMMRDPIERIFSSEKMNCRRRGLDEEQAAINTVDSYKKRTHAPKSQYEKTISAIESVFDPSDIHYVFYEELFKSKDLSQLYEFLELDDLIEADFGYNPLPSGKVKTSLDEKGVKEMRSYFDNTYKFVSDRFGAERISHIWKHF